MTVFVLTFSVGNTNRSSQRVLGEGNMADTQEAVLYGKLRRYARGARDPNQAGSCYVDSRYIIENINQASKYL